MCFARICIGFDFCRLLNLVATVVLSRLLFRFKTEVKICFDILVFLFCFQNYQVTDAIQKVAETYKCKPVEGDETFPDL